MSTHPIPSRMSAVAAACNPSYVCKFVVPEGGREWRCGCARFHDVPIQVHVQDADDTCSDAHTHTHTHPHVQSVATKADADVVHCSHASCCNTTSAVASTRVDTRHQSSHDDVCCAGHVIQSHVSRTKQHTHTHTHMLIPTNCKHFHDACDV